MIMKLAQQISLCLLGDYASFCLDREEKSNGAMAMSLLTLYLAPFFPCKWAWVLVYVPVRLAYQYSVGLMYQQHPLSDLPTRMLYASHNLFDFD